MARLPLHTLPAFRAVARLQNLRAAADELHLTHSAVSQQIKQLEDQAGVQLFDRVGRRLQINDAGRALQRAVEQALQQLDDGLRQATQAAAGQGQHVRLTLLSSFAQHWLLPRMAQWRQQHREVTLEFFATPRVVDLQAEGFHAAIRQGDGRWRGLQAERLFDSPLVALASPAAAARLRGRALSALADEPLLGQAENWQRWLALGGCHFPVRTVAEFNDAGHMLQAAEQDIGIALTRELLAADALRDGRLLRLSSLALPGQDSPVYWLVFPPDRADWPPLLALRRWLQLELRRSARGLPPPQPLLLAQAPQTLQPALPAKRLKPAPGTAAARR